MRRPSMRCDVEPKAEWLWSPALCLVRRAGSAAGLFEWWMCPFSGGLGPWRRAAADFPRWTDSSNPLAFGKECFFRPSRHLAVHRPPSNGPRKEDVVERHSPFAGRDRSVPEREPVELGNRWTMVLGAAMCHAETAEAANFFAGSTPVAALAQQGASEALDDCALPEDSTPNPAPFAGLWNGRTRCSDARTCRRDAVPLRSEVSEQPPRVAGQPTVIRRDCPKNRRHGLPFQNGLAAERIGRESGRVALALHVGSSRKPLWAHVARPWAGPSELTPFRGFGPEGHRLPYAEGALNLQERRKRPGRSRLPSWPQPRQKEKVS